MILAPQTVRITLSDDGGPDLRADIKFDPPLRHGGWGGTVHFVTNEILNLFSRLAQQAHTRVKVVQPPPRPTVFELVRAERAGQRARGYTAEHDHQHRHGQLTEAAAAFIASAQGNDVEALLLWPWEPDHAPDDQRHTRRENLVKAIACLVAEIERQDPALAEVADSAGKGAAA